MTLTDEQLDRIEEIMDEVEILSEPGQRSWIRALAAGMRELANTFDYYSNYGGWRESSPRAQFLRIIADELEAK